MKIIKGNLTYGFLIALIAIQVSYTLGEETAIKCVQCTGTGCDANVNSLAATVCTDLTAESCSTKIDASGIVTRGCLLPAQEADCTEANNCSKTDAEKNKQLVCKTCAASDAECSQTAMTDNTVKFMKICNANQAQCIINVKDKKVIRGCASADDVTACTDATTCKVCDNVFCNTGIFPTARINCYQCTESTCNDVTANNIASKPCLNYVADDKCYTKGTSETTMKRGCQSDVDTTANECSAEKEGCLFCKDSNCNNLKYKHDQALKCYQCTGSSTAKDCFNKQSGTDFKNCEKQILYNDVEYCYTRVNGDTITRGCLHDNTELTVDNCKDDSVCTKCTTKDKDGCNSAEFSSIFTCINCRSDDDPKCWNDAGKMTGKECRTAEGSAADGCFHGIWNGVAIRGCYIDADERQQYVCKDVNNDQCRICKTKDCNKENSSNGASTISMYFGLWLMILASLWYTY